MIEIDGSEGEGGGQMLRSSLTLALLTGKPVKLVHIRAGRSKPGLAAQHLACVRAASAICGGRYKGGAIGSQQLTFEPGDVKSGVYHFAIGTAGATALVMQTVALPLALRGKGPSEVTVTGGTHAAHAPTFDYLQTTWAGYLRLMGLDLTLTMPKPGFYPRGGGEIHAAIPATPTLKPLHLMTRVELTTATGLSVVASLPKSVAERQAAQMKTRLKAAGVESVMTVEEWQNGPSSVASAVFRQPPVATLFSALGERGKPAEVVADEAVTDALYYRESGAPVDAHAGDQLAVPLAFAAGESRYMVSDITSHLLTNLDIVRKFVTRPIECEAGEGSTGVVRIGPEAV